MPSPSHSSTYPTLRPWQEEFVSNYLSEPRAKSLLVAATGTGKTATALAAGRRMLEENYSDSFLVISDRSELRAQWQHAAQRFGLDLTDSIDEASRCDGASATLQSLRLRASTTSFQSAAIGKRWFIVADEMAWQSSSAAGIVDRMLALNSGSKALFIASHVPRELSFEAEFNFPSEFILNRVVLESRATEIQISKYAPSFSLLRQLQKGTAALDCLSWREFEKLIATLLEKDGYQVELMQGSKDGGVDVVAIKSLGPHGYFKALWQAKKQDVRNKVGISVVRELADTRNEFGASKGIIVTSSYLTRGALDRIDRNKFLLGKVDRNDLDAWIRRTLLRTDS